MSAALIGRLGDLHSRRRIMILMLGTMIVGSLINLIHFNRGDEHDRARSLYTAG